MQSMKRPLILVAGVTALLLVVSCGPSSGRYQLVASGNTDSQRMYRIDTKTGKTWVTRRVEGGTLVWVLVEEPQ